MYYPRVLVVANNSFSKTDNNGRTLSNLFIGWPREKLAQFCISTDGPNYEVCNNYYCVTDSEVLYSRIHFKKARRDSLEPSNRKGPTGSDGKGKKTAFRMLVRDLLWNRGAWSTKEFNQWVKAYNPELILILFSDSSFILDIATSLSQKLDVPLIMYNTEGFYFFKKNYFRTKTIFDWLWFPIYQKRYRRYVEAMMKRVSHSIYLNDLLKEDYYKRFKDNGIVLYTTSTLEAIDRSFDDELTFSYLGNLTHGRPKALLEIADVLQSINKAWILNVYGMPLDEQDEKLLEGHEGISYHGFVNYEEVLKVVRASHILFHAETQELERRESLKYGFSTKIADSISSGACFVLYASNDLACSRYIQETGAGWFASDKIALKLCIEEIVYNPKRRKEVLEKAKEIAKLNHSAQANCDKFGTMICEVMKEKYHKHT